MRFLARAALPRDDNDDGAARGRAAPLVAGRL